MQCSARSLVDAVAAHGIAYLAENLAVAYEFIDKQLAVLVVNIVVACAVYQQQIAFKSLDMAYGLSLIHI